MKIAIFYDSFGAVGGAEKTVLTLARGLEADVITTYVNKDVLSKAGFDDINIISVGDATDFLPLRHLHTAYKFSSVDFTREYDFFIFSGSWAHHASKRHNPNLWYCVAPVRMLYDLRESTIKRFKFPKNQAVKSLIAIQRLLDQKSIRRIGKIIVDSENVRRRVKRYYQRDSEVVYPPIDTKKFHYKESRSFWLSVNRLYPEKRIELQIKAFENLPKEKLLIVGGYSEKDNVEKYVKTLKVNCPENVKFLGEIPEEELRELYATCIGLVATAIDEDFGMTPVEAMAAGKPVVATKEGGYLETVIDGVTGRLVEPNVDDIVNAVNEISIKANTYREACEERAKNFDVSIFIEQMKEETL